MMKIHRELILLDQTRKQLVLTASAVALDHIEGFRFHNEKSTIDHLSVTGRPSRCVLANRNQPLIYGTASWSTRLENAAQITSAPAVLGPFGVKVSGKPDNGE